jgi:hypothetical protein
MGGRRAATIADLIMRRGDIQAQSALRSGDIWGGAINQLGQIASQTYGAHQEQKAQTEQSQAIDAVIQGWDGQDLTGLYKGLVGTGMASKQALETVNGFGTLRVTMEKLQKQEVPGLEETQTQLQALGALETADPGYVERNYQNIVKLLGPGAQAHFAWTPQEQWSPEVTERLLALYERFSEPEKMTTVKTVGPGGGPVEQAFTPAELAEGVPVWQKPEKSLAERAHEKGVLAEAGAAGTARAKVTEDLTNIDWTKTGEEFLATLPIEQQATVKQLGEYRRRPSASLYRSASGRQLLAMVSQYNPEYDEKLYGEGQKAIGEYTSGQTHRNIIAINTLSHHLVPFAEAAEALSNGDIPKLNELKNYFVQEFGGDAPTNFNALHHLVSDEIANTFKTTGATDSTIKNAAETVYAAQSPGQLLGALRRLARLAEGRIRAVGNKYDVTFGPGAFDQKGYVSSEARHAYEMIGAAADLGDISEGEAPALQRIIDLLEKAKLTPAEAGEVFGGGP